MASRFLTPLKAEWLEDERLKLTADLVFISEITYDTDRLRRVSVYNVPAGFETDLASVPWGLRNLVPAERLTAAPAVLHDWAYFVGKMTRAEADALFFEALEAVGRRRSTAYLMWLGVRAGGWLAWRKHRSTDDPGYN